jgi:predicted Fe-Mo cluster-binding NifX family protein
MKIAFASEENRGVESILAYHFGRCPYYVFVDVKDNKVNNVETKENRFLNRHESGVVPQFVAREKANVIIAGGMGPRAIDWFEKLRVKPITTIPKKIKDVLQDYLKGKLQGAESCDDHK